MSSNNNEKSLTLLNKFANMKKQLNAKARERRPNNTKETKNIQDCIKWRSQICNEISRKVTEIQNAMLVESKIRSINDYINVLIKEKEAWEDRIKELGGQDYRIENLENENSVIYNSIKKGNYMYFGRAKELPGVRELFETEKTQIVERYNKFDDENINKKLYQNIDFNYYGIYKDLEYIEKINKAIDEYETNYCQNNNNLDELKRNNSQNKNEAIINIDKFKELHFGNELKVEDKDKNTEKDFEELLLQKKKEELLAIINSDLLIN